VSNSIQETDGRSNGRMEKHGHNIHRDRRRHAVSTSLRLVTNGRTDRRQGCIPPAFSANAWRQIWSVHIGASAHARSSWTRTISNTNMYVGTLDKLLAIFLLNACSRICFKELCRPKLGTCESFFFVRIESRIESAVYTTMHAVTQPDGLQAYRTGL